MNGLALIQRYRLADIVVEVREGLEGKRRANTGVRGDLRFHVIVAEREHAAIGVMNEDDLGGSEQPLRDGQ